MPQPYFVPVMPSCSRITHSSGVSGSTSTVWTVPLTLSLAIRLLLAKGGLLRPCAADCSGAVEPRLSNSREIGHHPAGSAPAPVSPHTALTATLAGPPGRSFTDGISQVDHGGRGGASRRRRGRGRASAENAGRGPAKRRVGRGRGGHHPAERGHLPISPTPGRGRGLNPR